MIAAILADLYTVLTICHGCSEHFYLIIECICFLWLL